MCAKIQSKLAETLLPVDHFALQSFLLNATDTLTTRAGRKALGGSALSQVFGQVGNVTPDVHDVQLLKDFADALEQLHDSGVVMAYHGMFAC